MTTEAKYFTGLGVCGMITEETLWPLLAAHAGEVFYTTGRGSSPGVPFTYTIHGGEMHVNRKGKAITRATVMLAYQRASSMGGKVPGPKSLKVFGASYIYPVFVTLGIIHTTRKSNQGDLSKKEEPQMPRPKGSKNRAPQTIDERIEALEAELTALRETITTKETELAQLKETRDKELIGKLMDAIAESGKSVQDVIDMVKGDLPDELKIDE